MSRVDGIAARSGETWQVRAADAGDALALAALRWEFRATLGSAQEAEHAFRTRCAAWMGERLADARWRCWVVEAGGVVAGQLWLQPIEKIPNPVAEPERHAYISNFFLRPALRGQGAGSALFATAMAWSRANGVDAVILWPTPRSRPLYERHGFSASGGVMEAVVGSGRDLSGMA